MRVLIGIVLSSLLFVACAGGSDPAPPPPPPGSIRIVNGTSYPIDKTYVTPSGSTSWGAVRNEAVIPRSYSITIDGLMPGWWDALAVSYGDNLSSTYYAHAPDLDVVSAQVLELYATDDNFSGSIEVRNVSAYPITGVYVRPTASAIWSLNQLSASVPYLGKVQVLDLLPDFYDVLCDYSDGDPTVVFSKSVASFHLTAVDCY